MMLGPRADPQHPRDVRTRPQGVRGIRLESHSHGEAQRRALALNFYRDEAEEALQLEVWLYYDRRDGPAYCRVVHLQGNGLLIVRRDELT